MIRAIYHAQDDSEHECEIMEVLTNPQTQMKYVDIHLLDGAKLFRAYISKPYLYPGLSPVMVDFATVEISCITDIQTDGSEVNLSLPPDTDAYRDMVKAWDTHRTFCELVDTAGDDIDARRDFLAAEQVALNKALEKRDTYLDVLNSKRDEEE
jgi:hypothetical protein